MEALNANHSYTAPGSDGVRPPFLTVAVTGVPSANSGHCSAIPDAVATLWGTCDAVQDVLSTALTTVMPTPRTSLVLFTLQEPSNGMGTTL